MSIASQYVTGRKVSILIYPHVFMDAHIRSAYNLCSHLPFEELTASLGSAYSVSLLVVELNAILTPAVYGVCTLVSSVFTPTPASTYSLATAVT